jgi:murein L,D-transpeptidase YafK
MLTKEDTSADEFGITDADVAEWDAIVARYKTHPDEFMPLEEFKKRMDEDIKRYRDERRNKA